MELLILLISLLLSVLSHFLFPDYLIYLAGFTLIVSSTYNFLGTEVHKWRIKEYLLMDGRKKRLLMNTCLFLLSILFILFTILFSLSIVIKSGLIAVEWPESAISIWFFLFISAVLLSILVIEIASRSMIQTHKNRKASILLLITSIIFSLLSILIHEGISVPMLSRKDAFGVLNLAVVLNLLIIVIHRDFPDVFSIISTALEMGYRRVHYYRTRWGLWFSIIVFLIITMVLLIIVQFSGFVQAPRAPWEYVLTMISAILAVLVIILAYLAIPKERVLKRMEYEEVERIFIYSISLIPTIIFVCFAVLMSFKIIGNIWIFSHIDFSIFAILSATGPLSFYLFFLNRRILSIEEMFADLLRDIAESRKAGMTIANAISKASYGDYGLLTPYIKKMSHQLSLGLTFVEVLERFAKSVKSKLIRRGVALIIEAFHSGGNVAEALEAAANDITEIKYLEKERRTNMSIYLMVIYITFFVFLFTDAILYTMFLPSLYKASLAAGGAGLFVRPVPLDEMKFIYFSAAIVQALGNGLVAGVLSDSKVTTGTRHSFVMVLIAWATFRFFLQT